jgi:predicted O-methyltransferase YrrM
MNNETWDAVDTYFDDRLALTDPALDAAVRDSEASGLPSIQVAPNQGKLLHLLARMQGARAILEIGTLGGYSTIWLARALPPGGRLVTLELDPGYAAVARTNIERSGLSDVVEVRVGPAAESLATMVEEGEGPFDFVFIDADKEGYPEYLRWVLRLSRPGTVIVGDNVVRGGAVADASSTGPLVRGVREFLDLLAETPGVDATAVQTVGVKGHDGFALAVVGDLSAETK